MLETPRLRFRDFVLGDFDAVHAYASDPLVTRYTSFGPNTEAETRDFLGRMAEEASETPRKNHTFAVIQSSSQRLISGCGLDLADAAGPQYSLGYCFRATYWGQGIGIEAVRSVTAFGFSELNPWRIYAAVLVGNDASARLLQQLGFRLEGTHQQCVFARGAWHDEMIFALLKPNWCKSGA